MKSNPKNTKQAPTEVNYNKIFQISLILICFLVFGNNLKNKYNLDDEFYTNGNLISKGGLKSIPIIFTDFTFKNPNGDSYQYRPVTMLSFALESQLFGQKPLVSHLISLILYTGIILLLFNLLKKMLPDYNLWFIFSVCALFAVHPVHTEVVDNIKCRDELLALLFALLSIKFIIQYFQENKIYFLILNYLFLLLSFFSKVSVYPFMASIPLILYFFFNVKGLKLLIPVASFILVFATFYLVRHSILQNYHRELLFSENPLVMKTNFEIKSATSFFVLGKYLQLLIFPDTLRYYYGFKQIDITHWNNLFSILSLLIHLTLGVFALLQLKKKTILSFSILFYLLHISMYSNLGPPAPGIMGERFVFIASIGFCLALVYVIFSVTKTSFSKNSPLNNNYAIYILIFLFSVYSIRSFARNSDWKNKETLFAHDMDDLENSVKANMIYGEMLHRQALESPNGNERIELERKAMKLFSQATLINPGYEKAWGNKGTAHFILMQYDSALFSFKKSLELNSKSVENHLNLATTYEKLKQSENAAKEYKTTIGLDSTNQVAFKKLRLLYSENKQKDSIVSYLKKVIERNPKKDIGYLELGRYYLSIRDTAQTLANFEMAAKLNPHNRKLNRNLSNFFLKIGNKEKAKYYANLPQN